VQASSKKLQKNCKKVTHKTPPLHPFLIHHSHQFCNFTSRQGSGTLHHPPQVHKSTKTPGNPCPSALCSKSSLHIRCTSHAQACTHRAQACTDAAQLCTHAAQACIIKNWHCFYDNSSSKNNQNYDTYNFDFAPRPPHLHRRHGWPRLLQGLL